MKNNNCYITKSNVESALGKMISFESSLDSLFKSHNLDLRENSGRRNILLSQAQESFFANELQNSGFDVVCSGKTGEPDIVLKCIGRELECKITSSKNRSWPLQCDYSTLQRKGESDFLYVLADESFSSFAVLFFDSLTIEDFHFPAPGSRQKSRMNKSRAMKKCVVLHGEVRNKSTRHVKEYSRMLVEESARSVERIKSLNKRFDTASTENQKSHISRMIVNEKNRHKSKKSKIDKKIQYWRDGNCHYEIELSCAKQLRK